MGGNWPHYYDFHRSSSMWVLYIFIFHFNRLKSLTVYTVRSFFFFGSNFTPKMELTDLPLVASPHTPPRTPSYYWNRNYTGRVTIFDINYIFQSFRWLVILRLDKFHEKVCGMNKSRGLLLYLSLKFRVNVYFVIPRVSESERCCF